MCVPENGKLGGHLRIVSTTGTLLGSVYICENIYIIFKLCLNNSNNNIRNGNDMELNISFNDKILKAFCLI